VKASAPALTCVLAALLLLALAAPTPAAAQAPAAEPAAAEAEAPPSAARPAPPGQPGQSSPGGLRFEEIGAAAGARFVHSTRSFGDHPRGNVMEMFTDGGAAAAVGDYDGDGRDDLFLTSSAEGSRSHLLRNVTPAGGAIRFRDVTAAAGVGGGNTAHDIVSEALWLDYDNDGHRDLLVARFGTPLLYRNLGAGDDGTPAFRDVSAAVGLAGSFDNTISAIAFDYDGDGWLDLLLGHYFAAYDLLSPDTTPRVLPDNLDDAHNGGGLSLWHNVAAADGAGGNEAGGRRFVEVTEAAGLGGHHGWTLDLGHGDLDNDGDQDLYVAGDYGTDRLFWNRGDGTFVDATEETVGLDTRKGMNVDLGDYDRDGNLDVFVTNITDEYMRECNMLWHNNGDGTFLDLSRETGTCDSDWGWGGKFADLDNDGWLDLFTVNGMRSAGETNYIPVLLQMIITPGVDFSDVRSYPDIGDMTWSGYQRQRLFRNLGDGTFADVAAAAGVDNDLDGRGVAVADFDGDGRLDLVQSSARQPSLLYHNVSPGSGHWVAFRLTGGAGSSPGSTSNRDAVGARVTVQAGGQSWIREVNGGNGYAAQSSLVVHVGLGSVEHVESVTVRWPSGRVERLESGDDGTPPVAVDRLTEIVEGKGAVSR